MKKVAIFASGSGSNFEKIMANIEAGYLDNIQVTGLYVDQADAYAIERAKRYAVPVYLFELKTFASKEQYEQAILARLKADKVEWLILAGYMKLIGPTLLKPYEGRILNIHPSLLPSFPGKDAIGQAVRYGCRISGVTVHYVDAGMDTGTIIDQVACPVYADDTAESLQPRIQAIEYELYSRVIKNII
ncbi:phosphoribosylglycinamide formyltransferase [Macrococcus brunensis]|uniref:phosphoribosylglycinamide formyltransferase n=1 Tax=Macrococcus brunensis TaxID=198483 RepID=UPI001EF136D2|nr:phosphoribosylglycinamide formyltransferase [Macrococcus brunensis]ULG72729.1 phosphoribosylglycinamide formyltransferase [Macrococcus brunensis]